MLIRMFAVMVVIALLFAGCSSTAEVSGEANTAAKVSDTEREVTADAELTARVQAAIQLWADQGVTAEAEQDGRVTVSGTIGSEEMKGQIDEAIQGVAGVTRVRNRLRVSAEADGDTSGN